MRVWLPAALTIVVLAGCGPAPVVENKTGGLTVHRPASIDLPDDRPLRAGFLIVDGVYNSELMAPYDIFHHTAFHTKPRPGIEVFTV
ncbi:MAG: hypothetical protein R3344_13355, partial [Acidobacteriota bacterium]|nr:hypothetical protein [Acidobacteriota bacterium]